MRITDHPDGNGNKARKKRVKKGKVTIEGKIRQSPRHMAFDFDITVFLNRRLEGHKEFLLVHKNGLALLFDKEKRSNSESDEESRESVRKVTVGGQVRDSTTGMRNCLVFGIWVQDGIQQHLGAISLQ